MITSDPCISLAILRQVGVDNVTTMDSNVPGFPLVGTERDAHQIFLNQLSISVSTTKTKGYSKKNFVRPQAGYY